MLLIVPHEREGGFEALIVKEFHISWRLLEQNSHIHCQVLAAYKESDLAQKLLNQHFEGDQQGIGYSEYTEHRWSCLSWLFEVEASIQELVQEIVNCESG
jgi:hypothetical protein